MEPTMALVKRSLVHLKPVAPQTGKSKLRIDRQMAEALMNMMKSAQSVWLHCIAFVVMKVIVSLGRW